MCLSDKQGYPWSQGLVACSTQRGSHAVTQTHMLLFAEDKSWQFSRKKDSYAVKEIPEGSHHLLKKNWILWEREKSQTERPWWKGSAGFHNKISVLSFLLAGYYKLCKPGRLPKKLYKVWSFTKPPWADICVCILVDICICICVDICQHLSHLKLCKGQTRPVFVDICMFVFICICVDICIYILVDICICICVDICQHLSDWKLCKCQTWPICVQIPIPILLKNFNF